MASVASHRCLPRADEVTRVVDVRARGKVLRRAVKKLVILPTEPVDLHTDNIQHSGALSAVGTSLCTYGGRDVHDGTRNSDIQNY